MGWIAHIADTVVPELTRAVRAGLSAFRSARRKERHRYVLKAMSTEPGRILAPIPGATRYDLATIDRRLYIAEMEEARDTAGEVETVRSRIEALEETRPTYSK
jgi:hypothetical protein